MNDNQKRELIDLCDKMIFKLDQLSAIKELNWHRFI